MQAQCEVCTEGAAKYKCPQCVLKYCSVQCYKQHKETCVTKDASRKDSGSETLEKERIQEQKEEGELSDVELETTEDKVERHLLEKLEESGELKTLLQNPHLRVMMSALVGADNPGKLMEDAMKEPIFTEFADECLKVVEPEQT
ncbi:zinc finger HIT domain-containing protein 3-like [Haliotis rufescens]|uniref:zinc finger HIT domain-containing protein 3-like n=1 Tax=Haliotis rufescens TaxID=6454 RepID=UPI00201F13A8|nr:zinc finger HIT domain-containing protein 3-like [Haliotis rufescens]XP_046355986.2 zinc finger HIT domain-containing protein 3-like [Haliotis rufescens]XP_046355987.2 zinc finger HIT domain-containing protein 3-like [Haliotis rufescens]XP_048251990.1 zinc finger HIT domain-containing protein 3-like [Haliotis rufescens]XP_048251991.1 zinc finger HIT domain-containing protein 3-like [Haliotis rufescens]